MATQPWLGMDRSPKVASTLFCAFAICIGQIRFLCFLCHLQWFATWNSQSPTGNQRIFKLFFSEFFSFSEILFALCIFVVLIWLKPIGISLGMSISHFLKLLNWLQRWLGYGSELGPSPFLNKASVLFWGCKKVVASLFIRFDKHFCLNFVYATS